MQHEYQFTRERINNYDPHLKKYHHHGGAARPSSGMAMVLIATPPLGASSRWLVEVAVDL
jgi:ribosomal protein S17